MTVEIVHGFLISQTIPEQEALFISIDMQSGKVELRMNDKKPFGLPLESISENELFKVTTTIIPGTIHTSVNKADVGEYIDLLNHSVCIQKFNDHILTIDENFNTLEFFSNRIKELREQKIEKIIN